MLKNTKHKISKEALSELLNGAKSVYDLVSTTMGASGKLIGYKNDLGMYSFTKDGVTIAKQIELEDEPKNMGATAIIEAANKQVKESGDGTTLTTVLAYNFLLEGFNNITKGVNPTDLRNALKSTVEEITDEIKDQAIETTDETLKDIAIVSMNGNKEIGSLIFEAIKKVGEYGIVKHGEDKDGEGNHIEYLDGYQWQQGIQYKEFINCPTGLELENPLVLVTDKRLQWGHDLAGIAKEVGVEKPLLIISPEVSGEALGAIMQNKAYKFYTIKPEGMATTKKYMLEDVASLTGATFITEESGIRWEDIRLEHLGTAKKISATLETTTLISDKKPKERVKQLESILKTLKRSEFEEIQIKKSLARLTGGVAIIRTHADSEMEHNEIGDRIDDAVKACRSAIAEGITDGGGVALIKASARYRKQGQATQAERLAIKIVLKAIESPIRQILKNADRQRETDKIIADIKTGKINGYLISSGKGVSSTMVELGIVDPVKVIRTALLNAISVANMLLQTEGLIYGVKP